MSVNNIYRLSRWCKLFTRDNTVAFLHTISLAVIFISKKESKKILKTINERRSLEKIDEEIIKLLLQEKLLIEECYNEMNDLIKTRDKLVDNITLEMMYLLLTDQCNLKCTYCFEETPVISSKKLVPLIMMNTETADHALRFFAELTSKYGRKEAKKIIHLYGGEPLLNPKVVRFVIEQITKLKEKNILPKDCEIVLVTNGTLLTDEMARLFAKHHVAVGVSIDGPGNLNNIHRIAKNKKDSFQKARYAYELLKQHGVTTGISATITPEILKNFDEVLDFFINDLKIQDGISFNILYFNQSLAGSDDYFIEAAKCLIKSFERFRKLGIYEERIMRKVKAFIKREVIFADCSVVGNQIVIAPDGQVGVCQDFVKTKQYFKGSIFDKDYDPVASGLFDEWKTRSPFFMEQCFNCEALAICGGGCPASVELKTGNRWNIDERICSHSKLTLEWLIWDTYSRLTT